MILSIPLFSAFHYSCQLELNEHKYTPKFTWRTLIKPEVSGPSLEM